MQCPTLYYRYISWSDASHRLVLFHFCTDATGYVTTSAHPTNEKRISDVINQVVKFLERQTQKSECWM